MSYDSVFRPPDEVRDEMFGFLAADGLDPDSIPWAGSSDPPPVSSGQAAVLHFEGETPGATLDRYLRLLGRHPLYQVRSSFYGDRDFAPEAVSYVEGMDAVPGTLRWVVIEPTAWPFDRERLLNPCVESLVGLELLACALQQLEWTNRRLSQGKIWMPGVRWANPRPAFHTISLGVEPTDLPGGLLASCVQGEVVQNEPPSHRQMMMWMVIDPSSHRHNGRTVFIGDYDPDSMDPYGYLRASHQLTRIPRRVI